MKTTSHDHQLPNIYQMFTVYLECEEILFQSAEHFYTASIQEWKGTTFKWKNFHSLQNNSLDVNTGKKKH